MVNDSKWIPQTATSSSISDDFAYVINEETCIGVEEIVEDQDRFLVVDVIQWVFPTATASSISKVFADVINQATIIGSDGTVNAKTNEEN